mmetsp:Transcript_30829/g.89646  ORF Transcript_30829/g.89646 Transcript_30829/m.89646 type:complete len:298 (-) Transcript_30829:298-1191(-)
MQRRFTAMASAVRSAAVVAARVGGGGAQGGSRLRGTLAAAPVAALFLRRPMLEGRLGGAASAAAFAGAAGLAGFVSEGAPAAAEDELVAFPIGDFDAWASALERAGAGAYEEIPCVENGDYPTRWVSSGRRFIFDTLFGPGRIQRARMWRVPPPPDQDRGQLKGDEEWGHIELYVLLQLGDHLCGHPEYIHGGFLSAIFDEIFGWTSQMEKNMVGEVEAKSFTANLTVNYRRPVATSETYLLKCRVNKVVRGRKVYLEGTLVNARNELLTEATSLYIWTGLSSVNRRLDSAVRHAKQ